MFVLRLLKKRWKSEGEVVEVHRERMVRVDVFPLYQGSECEIKF